MIGEIGEGIDIVKKHGGTKASTDEALRKDLVEEMADVLMQFNDVMLCYGIIADELKQAYSEKFEKNMKRWAIPICLTDTMAQGSWDSCASFLICVNNIV